MLRNFSFLIDDTLAGCALPGTLGNLDADLAQARDAGVTALVTLTEDPLDEASVSRSGLRYLHLPIEDFTAPTLDQVERFVLFAEAEKNAGGVVLVHCHAGIGRTGTMLAAYLISQGHSAEEAARAVRAKRPGSVETRGQLDLLKKYQKSLKKKPGRKK